MSLLSVHALQPFLESNDICIYNIMQIEGMSLIRENRFNTVRFVASLYVYFIELKISVCRWYLITTGISVRFLFRVGLFGRVWTTDNFTAIPTSSLNLSSTICERGCIQIVHLIMGLNCKARNSVDPGTMVKVLPSYRNNSNILQSTRDV